MKISYFPKQIALNSEHVIGAFLKGCIKNGLTPVENTFDADAAVIWSVLWAGRMSQNREVYYHFRKKGKPVFIIEVGALQRRKTWKLSVNHIDSSGIFPNVIIDFNRPSKLGIKLHDNRTDRKDSILIAGQNQSSLLWEKMPPANKWVNELVTDIRKFTDRPIIFRPHPRFPVTIDLPGIKIQNPVKINGSYDDFDFDFDYYAVINHNSGPSVQSVIQGTPIICDKTSLAYPMSNNLNQINDLKLPFRDDWFINLCHTEWTVEEIEQGLPIYQLLQQIFDK